MAPFFEAAALALRAAPTCPTTPTCPQDDSCTYISNGASLQVSCATDYYGGDLQLVQTSTLAGCMRVCAGTTQCVAVSYRGRDCYMKNVLNTAQADEGVTGVVVVSREPTPTPSPPSTPTSCPTAFACPENDGCTLRGSNARIYALSCSTDYYGGDVTSLWAESLPVCAQACVENSQCVAASFGGGSGAGTCYLKDKNNGAGASENADAIALVTAAVPPPSATSSSPSSTATSSPVSSPTNTSATLSSPSPSATPTSTSAPVPTQVIVNGDFEGTSYTPWTLDGFALATGTVTGQTTTSPYNGDHSFQAQGESTNNYWLMEMSQTVTVVPGQAYDVAVWSKQAVYGNCDVTVNWNGESVFGFQPGTSYAEETVRIAAEMMTKKEGVLRLSVQCGSGGFRARLWLDDITMTRAKV